MKDLILGTAINYTQKQLELFLLSINKCFTGDVVLFSNMHYKLTDLNYNLKIINPAGDLDKYPKLNTANNYRYFLYLDYLKQFQYNKILLTDCRDVFFQSNPFNRIIDELLCVAVEDNTIGNCSYNANWIQTMYGNDYLEKVNDENIICSGTTIAVHSTIMDYLFYITAALEKFGQQLDAGNKEFVLDQGIHNKYCDEFSGQIKKNTNTGDLFLTAGYTRSFHINRLGDVTNNDGEVYSIIHQYDRIDWLSRHLQHQLKLASKHQDHSNVPGEGLKGITKRLLKKIKAK